MTPASAPGRRSLRSELTTVNSWLFLTCRRSSIGHRGDPMREHIEFIQAQRLPWEDATAKGFDRGKIKLLSTDPDDGSFSAVLRLPAGWSRPNARRPFD